MIYLNLTTKEKKKRKRGKITPPRMKKKNNCLLLFLFGPLVDFLCSSRGFVYLSFFYIPPPLSRMLFFSPLFLFLNTKYRVVDLLHRLTFALVPSLKPAWLFLDEEFSMCFCNQGCISHSS